MRPDTRAPLTIAPANVQTTLPSFVALPVDAKRDREEVEKRTLEAESVETASDKIDQDTQTDESGRIPILDNKTLWKKYSYEETDAGPIVTNEEDQQEIINAFRKLEERNSTTALTRDWFSNIPKEADLTLGDVHKVKTTELQLPIMTFLTYYTGLETLNPQHRTLYDRNDLEVSGYAYGFFFAREVPVEETRELPYKPAHFELTAIMGSGSYHTLKLHPALLQHARALAVWQV